MGNYVDGYVIPIQKKNLKAYRKMAQLGCKLWMKYGALDYYECVGDDLNVKWGWTFPKMCKLKVGETAIFAFIVYKSKAHRNQVNAKVCSAGERLESNVLNFKRANRLKTTFLNDCGRKSRYVRKEVTQEVFKRA